MLRLVIWSKPGTNLYILGTGRMCSYLLVGFWYNRKSAADARPKERFVTNRVGDWLVIGPSGLLKALSGNFGFEIMGDRLAELIQTGSLSNALAILLDSSCSAPVRRSKSVSAARLAAGCNGEADYPHFRVDSRGQSNGGSRRFPNCPDVPGI